MDNTQNTATAVEAWADRAKGMAEKTPKGPWETGWMDQGGCYLGYNGVCARDENGNSSVIANTGGVFDGDNLINLSKFIAASRITVPLMADVIVRMAGMLGEAKRLLCNEPECGQDCVGCEVELLLQEITALLAEVPGGSGEVENDATD